MEKAHETARTEGLPFVYLGNVHGHSLENIYCSNCQTLLIERTIYQIEKKFNVRTQRCPSCGTSIPIYIN